MSSSSLGKIENRSAAVNSPSGANLPTQAEEGATDNLQLTSPFLARFEKEGILKAPFKLNSEEEALALQIVYHASLPENFTFYDVLCFDLYQQIKSFKNLVAEEPWQTIMTDFQTQWFRLQMEENKDPSELLKLLEGLNSAFAKALFQKYAGQPNDPTLQDKRNSDYRYIATNLSPRVQFLTKFLKAAEGIAMLCDYPLTYYAGCGKPEAHLSQRTYSPLKRMQKFLQFIYESNCQVDPSLREMEEAFSLLCERLKGSLKSVVALEEITTAFAQFDEKLGERFFSFHTLFQRLVWGYKDHLGAILEVSKSHFSSEHLVNYLSSGAMPSFPPASVAISDNGDIIAKLKVRGKVSHSFFFTQEEQALIKRLFSDYPLDSDVTLLDLISFALYEKIGGLDDAVPGLPKMEIDTIRDTVGLHCHFLYLAFYRGAPSTVESLGSPTAFSEQYHSSLEKFIRVINESIAKLKILLPPPVNHLQRRVHDEREKQLCDQIDRSVSPLRDLLVRILQSKEGFKERLSLLHEAVGESYQGAKIMDSESPRSGAVLCRYWSFYKSVCAGAAKMFSTPVPYQSLDFALRSQYRMKPAKMEEFKIAIATALLYLSRHHEQYRSNMPLALAGSLTHAQWLKMHKSSVIRPKGQLEFIEQLSGTCALTRMEMDFIQDFLRLAEKHLAPRGLLSTYSSFERLRMNLGMYIAQHSPKSSSEVDQRSPLMEEVLSILEGALESKEFQEFIDYFLQDAGIKDNVFQYADLLMELAPLKENVQLRLDQALKALSVLPPKILENIKKDFEALPVDVLKEMQPEQIDEIRVRFFIESISLVRPILILADILALLQERHLYAEWAIIPKELAQVMVIEGIEGVLKEVIQAKTQVLQPPAPPQTASLPAPHEEEAQVEQPPAQPRQRVKTRKPPSVPPPSSSTSNHVQTGRSEKDEDLEDDLDISDIANMKKSRDIVRKLEELGFWTEGFKGSHRKMKNANDQTITVPNNDNMPIGTRRAIAKQLAAKKPPRSSDNNNNN